MRRNRKVFVAKNLLKNPNWVKPRPIRKGIKTTARCSFGFIMLIPMVFLVFVLFVVLRIMGIFGAIEDIDY